MMGQGDTPVQARRASTVMVMRPGSNGCEIFMVQRNRKTGFMPNAWVFPGGRVDDEDGSTSLPLVGGEAACEAMGLELEDGRPFLVAALRETFEETGIWLGRGQMTEELRERVLSGALPFEDALQQNGAVMDLERLYPWSWWVTPKIEPRRYDTRFFVVLTDGSYAGRHDERETVNSCWLRPKEALERAAAGSFPLAPPTWWTLKELDSLETLEAIEMGAGGRCHRPIQPILAQDASGNWALKLPGHHDHPEPAIPGLPVAVRFDQGRWWAAE